ncbi:recombination directionality factor [Kitasatospora aureofaciens]|uniref:recombination directionality factor n=1 Tax=Kitasatospora aureofaciens TaxID=1894 RepID=UPI0036F48D11
MPILDLQRRMRQLGEIRIGHTVDTGRTDKNGRPVKRPAKLQAFRFTSPSRPILEQVAALYGGDVRPWTPANGGPAEFEVYSTVDRLPVLVPPADAVSQWYELYQGSKCVRRCDGVTEHKLDRTCLCNPEKRDCSITTRVNVMLRDLPALGQWLLVSKGYYAAVELPPAAELLAQVGGYVAGWLGMEAKSVVTDRGTNRFMVPTLDVEITPTELMSGQIRGAAEVTAGAPERAAIEAAPTAPVPDYVALAKFSRDAGAVRDIWKTANSKGHMTPELSAALKALADRFTPDVAETAEAEEVIEPELVDDGDPTEVWFQIMAAAGGRGWTTDATEQAFAERNGGTLPGSASAGELQAFLAWLKGGAR